MHGQQNIKFLKYIITFAADSYDAILLLVWQF